MQPNQKIHSTLLIVGVTIALTFGQSEVVCPPSQDGFPVFIPNKFGKKYHQLIPNRNILNSFHSIFHVDCSKYFICQFDRGIEMSCPGNLQFDPSLNVCNYPSVVQCENSTPVPPSTTTTEMYPTTSNNNQTVNGTDIMDDYDEYDYNLYSI